MPSTVRWILTCRSYSLWGKLNTECPLRVLRFCIPWAADFKRIMVTNICMGIVSFWTLFSYTTGNTRGSWSLYWPLQDNKIQMSKKLRKKVLKILLVTFKTPKLIGWNKTENKDKYGMSLKSRNPKFKGKYFDISIGKFWFTVPSVSTGLLSLQPGGGVMQFIVIQLFVWQASCCFQRSSVCWDIIFEHSHLKQLIISGALSWWCCTTFRLANQRCYSSQIVSGYFETGEVKSAMR
jgi:hypothetical protein